MSNPIDYSQGIYDAKKLGTPRLLILGAQHMFAMFGATVLVPLLTGLSDEFHLVPVLDESGNIAGRNFIENARTKNIPEIHVQMMGTAPEQQTAQKHPLHQKHNAFRCRGCCGSVQPVSQNHQSSIVILVMTGICLGLFQVSGP